MKPLKPLKPLELKILQLRGHRVIIDADLADIYHVSTKALNQAVKRNRDRFPEDFMFQLSAEEKSKVVTNCDHLVRLKYSPSLPYAFTEHGAIMAASILNSDIAIHASIQVVRAFVRLREMIMTHKDLQRKIGDMEKKYDTQFKIVFDAIKQLFEQPDKKMKVVKGFERGKE